ncbi:MAG: hypothetical protein WCO65_00795 [bacterium]
MKKNISSSYVLRSALFFFALVVFYFPIVSKALTVGSPTTTNQNNNYVVNEIPTISTPACSVDTLTSNAPGNTVAEWGIATLSWTQSNCTTLLLSSSDQAFSDTSVAGKTSIETVPIGRTTSFILVGKDANGTISQKALTINMTKTTLGTSSTCQLYSFNANGSNYVQVTTGQYVTLDWNTSSGCTNVSISGNNGVFFNNQANVSNMNVGPFVSSVVYTLTATDFNGINQTKQVTVSVNNSYYNYNYGNSSDNCVVTNFTASPTYISSGQTTHLSWSTVGCSSVSITSANGSISNGYYLSANGSIQTNPIYGTTDLILTANGNNSTTWPPLTIYVTGGSYSYNNSQNSSGSNAITSIATNVGPYSAKLNGILVRTYYPTNAWFEYGVDTSMGSNTSKQNFSGQVTSGFNAVMYTTPSTTYYYRAVTESNGVISRGDIMSFVSKGENDTTVYAQSSNTTNTSATQNAIANPATGVFLSITNTNDKVAIGETVEYKIDYKNNTTKALKNVVLNISLPQGFTVTQITTGQITSPTLVTADLKTLAPGYAGSIFMQAKVGSGVSLTNTLVTNGSLSFTYPNGVKDSSVGYVLNHASGGVSSLGGFALGSGFFPTTVIGWLVTILIILAVILTIRRISKAKKPSGMDAHH